MFIFVETKWGTGHLEKLAAQLEEEVDLAAEILKPNETIVSAAAEADDRTKEKLAALQETKVKARQALLDAKRSGDLEVIASALDKAQDAAEQQAVISHQFSI